MDTLLTEQHTKRLEYLLSISLELGAFKNLETFIAEVLVIADEIIQCQASAIILYNDELDRLDYTAVTYPNQAKIYHLHPPKDKSVAGLCFEQSAPIVVEDAHAHKYFYAEIDKELGFKTEKILATPIAYHETKIGVFQAVNKQQDENFSDSDVATSEVIANYLGIAIQRVRNDHELQKARAKVKELDRLKSDFIAITSHELRTPLGLILGHATFLQETVKDESDQQQLEVILKNAKRLKDIIETISNVENYFTGKATLRLSKIDAKDIIKNCISTVHPKAMEKRISLNTHLPDKKVTFIADPEKVKLAIHNILDNAVIFSNIDGKVTVTLEQSADFINISIVDNGIGIPAQDMDKIFERFFQVQSHMTRHHGGLGLGLAESKAMIDLHRGQIWVESAEGKGTSFMISLPKDNHETNHQALQ